MSTATRTKTTTKTPTKTIAQQLAEATTPSQKSAVTRKINIRLAQAESEGKNPTMVLAGYRAAATRILTGTANIRTTPSVAPVKVKAKRMTTGYGPY